MPTRCGGQLCRPRVQRCADQPVMALAPCLARRTGADRATAFVWRFRTQLLCQANSSSSLAWRSCARSSQQAISGTRTAVPTAQELPFQRTWPEPRIGYGHKAARRQWCRPHRLSSNGAAPGCRPRGHCAGRSSTGHRDAVPLRPRSLRPRCLLREGRSLQHVGVADHAVTLEAPWTGSG